ncbi:helix-turn-helix transcriptional regulator [Actinomadura sp. GTD37]|uniref:helix-turn-helix transcriptional regulator n=1 Tax=Actinomadura sp. GTD37 TaxID=1778030 RepID=UPI0035C0531B
MSRQDDRSRRVARYVAARRNDLGLSQRGLAERAGINHKTVHAVESGKHWPQLETQQKLEPALGWDDGDIVRIADGRFPASGPLPQDDPDGAIAAALAGGPDDLETKIRAVIADLPERHRPVVEELYEQLLDSERQRERLLNRILTRPQQDGSSPGTPEGGASSSPSSALPGKS